MSGKINHNRSLIYLLHISTFVNRLHSLEATIHSAVFYAIQIYHNFLYLSDTCLYRTLSSWRSSKISFLAPRDRTKKSWWILTSRIVDGGGWGRGCRPPLSVLAKIDLSKPSCCIKLLFVFIPRPVIGKMAGRSGTHHHLSTDNTFSGKIFSTS